MNTQRSKEQRQRALRAGARAEYIAAVYLLAKGYRPMALRYAAHGGEVDLIARRGRTVIFVEVKARSSAVAALEAIGSAKTERFRRAVDAWIMRNPWSHACTLRADAVLIAPWRKPQHIEHVFDL